MQRCFETWPRDAAGLPLHDRPARAVGQGTGGPAAARVERTTAWSAAGLPTGHSGGSIAATVRRPGGEEEAGFRINSSACLKLQNVSGNSGRTRRAFTGTLDEIPGDPAGGREPAPRGGARHRDLGSQPPLLPIGSGAARRKGTRGARRQRSGSSRAWVGHPPPRMPCSRTRHSRASSHLTEPGRWGRGGARPIGHGMEHRSSDGGGGGAPSRPNDLGLEKSLRLAEDGVG